MKPLDTRDYRSLSDEELRQQTHTHTHTLKPRLDMTVSQKKKKKNIHTKLEMQVIKNEHPNLLSIFDNLSLSCKHRPLITLFLGLCFRAVANSPLI